MAGTPRAKQSQALNPHELARLLARLMMKLPSSAWVDAQFIYIADVDAHGQPRNTVRYAPSVNPCPPRADSPCSRMRSCAVCGRITPRNYMIRGPKRGVTNRQVWQCQDCAIAPDDPADEAYGPSPHHTFLEAARLLRIRSDGWSKKI